MRNLQNQYGNNRETSLPSFVGSRTPWTIGHPLCQTCMGQGIEPRGPVVAFAGNLPFLFRRLFCFICLFAFKYNKTNMKYFQRLQFSMNSFHDANQVIQLFETELKLVLGPNWQRSNKIIWKFGSHFLGHLADKDSSSLAIK